MIEVLRLGLGPPALCSLEKVALVSPGHVFTVSEQSSAKLFCW